MSATKWGVQVLSKVKPARSVNINWEVGKHRNQLELIQEDAAKLERNLQKINYTASEYCKVGLLHHDQLKESDPVVQEARQRMTDEEVQARYFRVNRALLMSANHQILPQDEWTPMDADHNYLQEHLNDARNEMKEKKLMKCAMLDFEDRQDRLLSIPFRFMNYIEISRMRQKLKAQLVAPQLAWRPSFIWTDWDVYVCFGKVALKFRNLKFLWLLNKSMRGNVSAPVLLIVNKR